MEHEQRKKIEDNTQSQIDSIITKQDRLLTESMVSDFQNNWMNQSDVFKQFVENSPIFVYIYRYPKVFYVNSTFMKIFDYTMEEICQMNYWDICSDDHKEMARTRGIARLSGDKDVPTNYELKMCKKSGEPLWIHVFFAVTHINGVPIGIVGGVDITERKRLKDELQIAHDELENRVRQRTDELNRMNQELTFLNQNLTSVLKYISDGVITISRDCEVEILNPFFSPVDSESIAEVKSQMKDYILNGRTKLMSTFFVDKKPFRNEEVMLRTKDGLLHLVASGTPILNESGDVDKGVIILRPIKEVHSLINRFSGTGATFSFNDIITGDPVMLQLINDARTVASSMNHVLIQGESGTGKELFAQAIHNESPRARGPFLAVNCGAIPRELIGSELFGYKEGAFTGAKKGGSPGKFELASGGTIFLDEIGDMPFEQQVALLRVIQEKTITRLGGHDEIPVDVRIVCATNKDLVSEMKKGNFRNDLYYRLNVINIKIPPLRERREDIILLFRHFVKQAEARFDKNIKEINPDVFDFLLNYDWHGNIRELQNVVERMLNVMQGPTLEIEHLPVEVKGFFSNIEPDASGKTGEHQRITIKEARELNKKLMAESEKKHIMKLLGDYNGNISRIAAAMGISRKTLYKKMEYYQI